ncbi:hypothetical protein JOE09_000721 [Pantoea coffeiphila]|nr:hypothetical protein [Pantoea coffeiphila]
MKAARPEMAAGMLTSGVARAGRPHRADPKGVMP